MNVSFDFAALMRKHAKQHKSKSEQCMSVAGGIKKRLETNAKHRKSSRLSVFDRIRNLSQCEIPKTKPEEEKINKLEHRKQQLEKWKAEKEKRKKEEAASKKKPFLTGIPHQPLKYVPPPPLTRPGPSTSGRVTRSQNRNNKQQENKENKIETKSFAPKNAQFHPPIANLSKAPVFGRPKAKNEKYTFRFEPLPPPPPKEIRTTRRTKQAVDAKLVAAKPVVADKRMPRSKTVPTISVPSSSSSELESSTSSRTGRSLRSNATKEKALNSKAATKEKIQKSNPKRAQKKSVTPKNKIPKSESSSEERLRSPKSTVDVVMSPEQIIAEAKKISPCVTLSRGKDNARREMKKKLDEGLLDEDASDMDSVEYFRKQLASEIKRMTEMCDTWDKIMEQSVLPETVQEGVLGATGQARLLMSKKLQQFSSLVERCARPEPGHELVTPADLHGFWDMVFMQIENVDMRFKKLEELRSRNWVEEQPVVKPKIVKPVKPAVKPAVKAGGPSKLREMIAAARKAKKDQNHIPDEPPESKSFEAGFFSVTSPVRSPATPRREHSLLKTVLSSEAKKSASKNAPFAMLRASIFGRNIECDGVAPLPATPQPQAPLATPGRSILKNKDSTKKIDKKSIKVVLFDKADESKDIIEVGTDSGISSVENEHKENKKPPMVRQDAIEITSPVMTRNRRKSLQKSEDDKPLRRSSRRSKLEEIDTNIEKNTPKRSRRRQKVSET